MSVLSRWRGRLRIRRGLEASAKQRHTVAQRKLTHARRRDAHPRQPLVDARAAASDLLGKRRAQVAAAKRVIRRHEHDETGAGRAVKWALSQVGTTEQPAGSNWGPKISDWITASGYGYPVPYCQCGANATAVHGGAPQLRTGYTPTVLDGIGGYQPIPVSQAKPGDFIYFKWPGISRDPCDHVGVLLELTPTTVKCVEFNTSPGNAGSQNNGGGVYIRTRSRSLVVGAVHPPYEE